MWWKRTSIVDGGSRASVELGASISTIGKTCKRRVSGQGPRCASFPQSFGAKEFEEMVDLKRDYIRKGDMFQCVLSQRFSADFQVNHWIITAICA